MKKFYFLITLVAVLTVILFNSCSNSTSPNEVDTTPVIDKITPDTAQRMQAITITGKNFGDSRGSSYVDFYGIQPASEDYSSWSSTSIIVAVPKTATTGIVKVFVNGVGSKGVIFFVDTVVINNSPVISSIDSTIASVGSSITIKGKNFGATKDTSYVTFNGVRALNYPNWQDSLIKVTVPQNGTSGKVIVTVKGKPSNGVDFTVRGTAPPGKPHIDSISPLSANQGQKITIFGNNFGAIQGSSVVQFGGGINANYYQSWSGTAILVEVPANSQTGLVKVIVSGDTSNGVNFTVNNNQNTDPVITSLDQTTAQPGQKIGIIGKNFGQSQGSNYVEFNGTKAITYNSWADTKIVVQVPDNASSGNVYVWVNGKQSNGLQFTVQQPNYIVPTVLIPAGTFNMGSNDPTLLDTKPIHQVKISKSFLMSVTEITQKQWGTVRPGSNPSKYVNDNNPVEQVTFPWIADFCNKLSSMEGRQPCYNINGDIVTCDFTKNGYRLPTEAEWEYAARGGRATDYDSTEKIAMGWFSENANGVDHNVKTKQPNEYGLYDMFGNVNEWCWDFYNSDYYKVSPSTDPTGPADDGSGQRVMRGGSFVNGVNECNAYKRDSFPSMGGNYNYNLGFRVVRIQQ